MIDVTNVFDEICNWSILFYYEMAELTNTSYGFVNTLTFVILMPLAIMCFAVSSLIFNAKRTTPRKVIGGLTFTIGLLATLSVVFLTVYTLMKM